jgi:DNA-binding CsgD family transcriptional regulator
MKPIPEGDHDPRAWRRSPFGSVAVGTEAAQAATIQDAARRCRWIAIDLSADGFALFHAGPALENGRLAPCFDADFPITSPFTRRLVEAARDDLVKLAPRSSRPCWWSSKPQGEAATVLAQIPYLEPVAPPFPGPSSLAFPVHAERGQCGLIVFWGERMQIGAAELFDFHARCYALFDAVVRIRPGNSQPSLSPREQECLKLTANGYTSEDIAKLLKLSVHTTNQYLANTAQKLNAVNRMHAVAKALRLGIIE